MSKDFFIACKDCKIIRSLDSFYSAVPVQSRKDTIDFANKIQEQKGTAFRCALVVSFMAEHEGHDCVFFDEQALFEYKDFSDDNDFWTQIEDETGIYVPIENYRYFGE